MEEKQTPIKKPVEETAAHVMEDVLDAYSIEEQVHFIQLCKDILAKNLDNRHRVLVQEAERLQDTKHNLNKL